MGVKNTDTFKLVRYNTTLPFTKSLFCFFVRLIFWEIGCIYKTKLICFSSSLCFRQLSSRPRNATLWSDVKRKKKFRRLLTELRKKVFAFCLMKIRFYTSTLSVSLVQRSNAGRRVIFLSSSNMKSHYWCWHLPYRFSSLVIKRILICGMVFELSLNLPNWNVFKDHLLLCIFSYTLNYSGWEG